MENWILDNLEKTIGKNAIEIQKVPNTFSTQTVQLTFEKGAILPIHITPVNVLFYIIQGKGLITIGDEKQECIKGTFIESPKNIPHGWENISNEKLKVLVIKLY